MAYNFFVEIEGNINWDKLNKGVTKFSNKIEFFPILSYHSDSFRFIGISIPLKFLELKTINELEYIINFLFSKKHKVYDLYHGIEITNKNIDEIIKSIIDINNL